MRVPARSRQITLLGACLLLVIAVATFVGACSSQPSPGPTASTATTENPTSTVRESTSTTTPAVTMSAYDRELAKTVNIQHRLSVYLTNQSAPPDDPRMGLVYGLKARVQALTCRNALAKGELELADYAMKDVYLSLNLGRDLATGVTAQTLAEARSIVETLGVPSDRPQEAADLLDQFIARLAPLLQEAEALMPTTSS